MGRLSAKIITDKMFVQVPALRSAGQAEEALYHWMCNLARQEGLEEKVAGLARRCMAR